jgi:DNA-binding transcriptional LysR family regulator
MARDGCDDLIVMSNEHWVEVIGTLEANLLVGATVLHLGLSPLIKLLVNRYPLHVVATLDDVVHDDDMPSTSFDIVIVHLPSFKDDSFKRLLKYMAFEYLLVLSHSCSGSPTDLHVQRFNGTRSYYSLVEDVCAEADVDVGGSLFRLVLTGTEEEWSAGRYILSRRIKTATEILVTRRTMTTNNRLFV